MALTPVQLVVWGLLVPAIVQSALRVTRHVVNQYWWSSLPLWKVDVAFGALLVAGLALTYWLLSERT